MLIDTLPNATATLGSLEYYGDTFSVSYNWTAPSPLETWQQWGISIQHPSGFQASFEGNLNQSANSNNGIVRWLWNANMTRLYLLWEPGSSDYNFTRYFLDNYEWLQKNYQNVSLLSQGNMTMAGTIWQYQTYTYAEGSQQFFLTCASAFYPNTQRIYFINFVDSQQDSLSGAEFYGNTFTG
jgi:hypothetical protein